MKKLLITLLLTTPVFAQQKPSDEKIRASMDAAFSKANDEWKKRIHPDDVMDLCNKHGNTPSNAIANDIIAKSKASVIYPADNVLTGDWKLGERGSLAGAGMRFTDAPTVVNGGNCYACHELSPKEISFGTLGPSLKGYGKIKGNTPASQKELYDKIYNSNVTLACSLMPRLGHNKYLSPEQIRHFVSFLLDPESPVNK
jgi:sulfur-oxidizing protein SoxX